MRALVMAAGLGTRLRPLTNTLPKPLVPLNGRPLVEFVLEVLAANGIVEAMMNVHYLPEKMRDFVEAWNFRGGVPRLRIQDESREILGSGGAIALAADWLFAEETSALICNSDVILKPAPDLLAFARHHRALAQHGVECTLSAMEHQDAGIKYNALRVEQQRVRGFEQEGRHDAGLRLFPGYYFMEKNAVKRMPAAGTAFSVVDALWRPLVAEGKLGTWDYRGAYYDLGTVQDLREAEAALVKSAR